jgi:hypothetical protein
MTDGPPEEVERRLIADNPSRADQRRRVVVNLQGGCVMFQYDNATPRTKRMVKVVELRARLSTYILRGLNSARGRCRLQVCQGQTQCCRSARDCGGGGKGRQGSGKRVVNKMKGETGGSLTACSDFAAKKRALACFFRHPPLAMWKITPTFGSCFSVFPWFSSRTG